MKTDTKSKSTAKLKKKLDKIFSLFIRLRDTNKDGYGECYTCGKRLHYKQGHCGHFIPRNILITRWDENNCKLQCPGCNLWGNGKILDFEDHLVKEIGRDEVDKMKASRFGILKVDSVWYENKITYYSQLINTS